MNTVQFPDSQEVEIQAANWIAAIDRGLSNSEESDLKEWLETSPLHGELLVKCASMWDLLDLLRPIAKLMPIVEDETLLDDAFDVSKIENNIPSETTRLNAVQSNRTFGRRWNIAASFVMVALLAWLASSLLSTDMKDLLYPSGTRSVASGAEPAIERGQTYKTAVGEISNVSLADGSKLKLNTNSEVRVNFSDRQRTVNLIRGEVFFDVAKDSNKPFVVNTGSEQVTAIGTAFSVDLSHLSTIEVLVTHGKVRVGHAVLSAPSPYSELFLTPGQKVVIRNNMPQVSTSNDVENQLAWRDGMVVFEGESLAQAISEIDRYTPLSFKIVDAEIASIPVGGYFRTGDLDQLLLILEQNFGVKASQSDNEIILSKAPSNPNE